MLGALVSNIETFIPNTYHSGHEDSPEPAAKLTAIPCTGVSYNTTFKYRWRKYTITILKNYREH